MTEQTTKTPLAALLERLARARCIGGLEELEERAGLDEGELSGLPRYGFGDDLDEVLRLTGYERVQLSLALAKTLFRQ